MPATAVKASCTYYDAPGNCVRIWVRRERPLRTWRRQVYRSICQGGWHLLEDRVVVDDDRLPGFSDQDALITEKYRSMGLDDGGASRDLGWSLWHRQRVHGLQPVAAERTTSGQ